MWSLDSGEEPDGEVIKTLMISLVKPPLTETEITWKRGATLKGPFRMMFCSA